MASVKRTKSGTVLTHEIEEALADEAEAGYDLGAARPTPTGRPSLGRGVSPRMTFALIWSCPTPCTAGPRKSAGA